jgi:hypothetical protein
VKTLYAFHPDASHRSSPLPSNRHPRDHGARDKIRCNSSTESMTDWTRQKRVSKRRDSSSVVVTKYTVDVDTAKEIRKAGPVYGSQGRAVQIGTEMLIRMEKPPIPASEPESDDMSSLVRVSMRLHKRTFEVVRELARLKYNDDPGQVIAACVKVLKMKRIKL